MRASMSTDVRASPTVSETRRPAPYMSSTSARSRSARGVVPFAASIRRSDSDGESVRGSLRMRRGVATSAAGLSVRAPRSIWWRKYERTAAMRRAIVDGREARGPHRRDPGLEDAVVAGADGRAEERGQRCEVAPVGVDRPRRPLRGEQQQVALDIGVEGPAAAGRRRRVGSCGWTRFGVPAARSCDRALYDRGWLKS